MTTSSVSPAIGIYLSIYALLIAFGSLYTSAGLSPEDTWSLSFLFDPLPRYITRTDISTNLLVYLPFGYLLARRFGLPRQRARGISLALLVGGSYSVLMESMQEMLSDRIASNLDVFLNLLGALLGALLALHHNRWRRAGRALRRWRLAWFRESAWASLGLWLLALWGFAQFSLLPFPGAGWLGLHLRPFDTPPDHFNDLNSLWFLATFLEMSALGAFTACLLKPRRYVGGMLMLFAAAFAMKLLVATILLKLRAVGGVMSLETLAAFLLAFWLLLIPLVSKKRRSIAVLLLLTILLMRWLLADYLLWPIASVFNIAGMAKAVASFWPYLALAVLAASALPPARRPAR